MWKKIKCLLYQYGFDSPDLDTQILEMDLINFIFKIKGCILFLNNKYEIKNCENFN